jgi:hypothetical protein
MNTISDKLSLSSLSVSADRSMQGSRLDGILFNLSCMISKEFFDLKNAGISIYDPFVIQEDPGRGKREFRVAGCRAISLRSKSTRCLHQRRHRRRNLS